MTYFPKQKIFYTGRVYTLAGREFKDPPLQGTVLAAPRESKLLHTDTAFEGVGQMSFNGLRADGYYFQPDAGGTYTISFSKLTPERIDQYDQGTVPPSDPIHTFQVTVAERLSRKVGLTEYMPPTNAPYQTEFFTLTIYVDNGAVVRTSKLDGLEATPMMSNPSTAKSALAITDPNVIAAAANLAGKAVSQLMSTDLPALESAFAAALSNPTPTSVGHDPGAAQLIANGWSR